MTKKTMLAVLCALVLLVICAPAMAAHVAEGVWTVPYDADSALVCSPGPILQMWYDDGGLYLLGDNTFSLDPDTAGTLVYRVDLSTFAVEAVDAIPPDGELAFSSYDAGSDTRIFLEDGDLWMRRAGEEALLRALPHTYYTPEGIGPKSELYATGDTYCRGVLAMPDGRYAVLLGGVTYTMSHVVYIDQAVPIDAPIETLKVDGMKTEGNAVAEESSEPFLLFQLANPGVRVETWDSQSWAIHTGDRIASQSEVLDVYTASSVEGLAALMRSSLMQPFAPAGENVASIYPQIQEQLCRDGQVYFAPVGMRINVWRYDKTAWDALDLGAPPADAEALFSLLRRWFVGKLYEQGEVKNLIGGQIYGFTVLPLALKEQYVYEAARDGRDVAFDTPLFRALLKEAKAAAEINIDFTPGPGLMRYAPVIYTRSQVEYAPSFEPLRMWVADGLTRLVPPSLLRGGDAAVGAKLTVLYMGKDAPNPELAARYLSFVLAYPTDSLAIMLSPDENTPIPLTDPELSAKLIRARAENIRISFSGSTMNYKEWANALDAQVNRVLVSPFIVSAEEISFYRSIAPYLVFFEDDTYPELSTIEVSDYLRGEIDEDALIAYLNEKIR